MKTHIKNPFSRLGVVPLRARRRWFLLALIAGLGVATARHVRAQCCYINGDGIYPEAVLVLSGNVLYGTATRGGASDQGTVFKVNTDGTGFATLHAFHGADGANPHGGLVASLSGDILYGTTESGGSWGNGTVFALNADGTGFKVLHSFSAIPPYPGPYTNSDGALPYAGLVLSGDTLYGSAFRGGGSDNGTIFALRTDGTGFAILHSFAASSTNSSGAYTNAEGANPYAGVFLSGGKLYGTASLGGDSGAGTVFSLNTNGAGFAILHSFAPYAWTPSCTCYANSDGIQPYAALLLSDNTLYGSATRGGSSGNGTLFALRTDGSGFTNLHNFTSNLSSINSDGAQPYCGLILSSDTLYGATYTGGPSGSGTLFAVRADGSGFANLHSFMATSDGASPQAGLVLSGTRLYGTAPYGGSFNSGAIFAVNTDGTGFTNLHSFSAVTVELAPLTVAIYGTNVVVSWPFTSLLGPPPGVLVILESATNLAPPVTWTPVSYTSVIVNGQNMVTNSIAGPQQFYRLHQVSSGGGGPGPGGCTTDTDCGVGYQCIAGHCVDRQ